MHNRLPVVVENSRKIVDRLGVVVETCGKLARKWGYEQVVGRENGTRASIAGPDGEMKGKIVDKPRFGLWRGYAIIASD